MSPADQELLEDFDTKKLLVQQTNIDSKGVAHSASIEVLDVRTLDAHKVLAKQVPCSFNLL